MASLYRSFRASVSLKLLIVLALVLLLAVLAILLPLRVQMRNQIVEDLQNQLRAIAQTAVLQLDGDLLRQVRRPGDERTAAFVALRHALARVRDVNQLGERHLYTFYRDERDPRTVRFGVMTHAKPFVGDPYTIQPEMLPVFEEGRVSQTDLYEDAYGQWISAYAPIFDSAGRVAGLLEVDREASAYFARYRDVTRLTMATGLLTLAMGLMLGWLVLNRVVIRPMRAVQDGMQALRRSEFAHRVTLSTGDEFELLGETFNRLARELNAARSVQASFAPRRLPGGAGGWAIAAISEPCEATAGDYVDAFELPGGRIGVVVADVTGHGLAPALLMSACRSALRALSAVELSPAKVIDRLDKMISDDLTDGRFITMIFGVLESDGRFTYCNAGHGPALHVAGGRDVGVLPPHRPPVGLNWSADGDDGESTLSIDPGGRLLLASDGITEAWSERDEQFGDERLIEVARDPSAGCDEVVRRLVAAVAAHRGRRAQSDDITVLCVDRVATAPGLLTRPGGPVAIAATS